MFASAITPSILTQHLLYFLLSGFLSSTIVYLWFVADLLSCFTVVIIYNLTSLTIVSQNCFLAIENTEKPEERDPLLTVLSPRLTATLFRGQSFQTFSIHACPNARVLTNTRSLMMLPHRAVFLELSTYIRLHIF